MPWLTDLNNTCSRINASATAERVLLKHVSFAGIPQVLILNLIIAGVLLLGFTLLKKSAWAFRLFSLRRDQFFNINVAALFYGPPKDYAKYKPEEDTEMRKEERALIKEASGAFRWIWVSIFKLKERHFLHRCGQQAVDYLRFQRVMLYALLVASAFSLIGLLPLHLVWGAIYGNIETDQYSKTTIANIDGRSYWVLAHVLFTIFFSIIVYFIIRRVMKIRLAPYFVHRKYRLHSRTLMVSNVPTDRLRYGESYDEHLIRQYFATAYPECNLIRVDLTYNTGKLRKWVDKKVYADFCRDFYVERKQQIAMHQAHPADYESVASAQMYPIGCQPCRGKVCLRFCCSRVDGEDYYAKEANKLEVLMAKEAIAVQQKPTTVIFLTFESHQQAKTVKIDFQVENRLFAWCLPSNTGSSGPRKGIRGLYYALHVNEWDVNFAPLPRYVSWDNLPTGGWKWWLRAIALNVLLFWFVFFLSTPPILVRFVIDALPWLISNPFLAQWLPTISILILPILLPIAIEASVGWAGYYTQMRTDYVKLRNVYLYLLLTLVILPGIGVGSANAALIWFEEQARKGGPKDIQWECVLLPSAGSFFINVMIAMALLWNAFDVIRIIELVMFEVKFRCFTKSDAERAEMNRRRNDFAFTTNYAYLLTMYSTAVIFGFLSPLTTAFGVLYMCVKHVFDKYSLFYYTTPVHEIDHSVESRLSTGLHLVAVRYVFVAHFIQHFVMTFFTFLRGSPRPVYIISFISTISIVVFVLYQLFFAEYVDQAMVDNMNETLRLKEDSNVAGEGGRRLLLYEAPVFRQSRAHTSPGTPLTTCQQPVRRGSTPASPATPRVFDYKDAARLPNLPSTAPATSVATSRPSSDGTETRTTPTAATTEPAPGTTVPAAPAAPLTDATEGVTPAKDGDIASVAPAEEQEQAAIEDDTIPVEQARTATAIPSADQQDKIEAAAIARGVSRWRRNPSAAATGEAEAAVRLQRQQSVSKGSVDAIGLLPVTPSDVSVSENGAKLKKKSDVVKYNKSDDAVVVGTVGERAPPRAATTTTSPVRKSSPVKQPTNTTSPRHAKLAAPSDDDNLVLLTAMHRNKGSGGFGEDEEAGSPSLSKNANQLSGKTTLPTIRSDMSMSTSSTSIHDPVRNSLRSAREAFFSTAVGTPEACATLQAWPPVTVVNETDADRVRQRRSRKPPVALIAGRSSDRNIVLRNVPRHSDQQQKQEHAALMLSRSQSVSPVVGESANGGQNAALPSTPAVSNANPSLERVQKPSDNNSNLRKS